MTRNLGSQLCLIDLIFTIPNLQAMIRSMVESLSADLTTGSDLIDNAEKRLGSEQPLNEEIRPLQQQETEHQVRYFPIFKTLFTVTCDCEKLKLSIKTSINNNFHSTKAPCHDSVNDMMWVCLSD